MAADSKGRPYIATYWRSEGSDTPQYRLVYHDGSQWKTVTAGSRSTPFSLSGGGTKRIPISRPKVLIDRQDRVFIVFRDAERGDRVSVAIGESPSLERWRIEDLTAETVGLWEPSYDTRLWERDNVLNLFVQFVGQGDAETLEELPPQMIFIVEWKP